MRLRIALGLAIVGLLANVGVAGATPSDGRATWPNERGQHVVGLTSGGVNKRLYHSVGDPGKWQRLANVEEPAGAVPGSIRDVATASVLNELHVFAVSDNGGVYRAIRLSKEYTWEKWTKTPFNFKARAVAAQANRNAIYVAALSDEGKLAFTAWTNGGWSEVTDVLSTTNPLPAKVVDVAIGVTWDFTVHMVVAGENGRAYHTLLTDQGWQKFWGDVTNQTGDKGKVTRVAAMGSGNDLDVALLANNTPWSITRYSSPEQWGAVVDVKTPAGFSSPSSDIAVAAHDQSAQMVVSSQDTILHSIRSGKNWKPKTDVEKDGGQNAGSYVRVAVSKANGNDGEPPLTD